MSARARCAVSLATAIVIVVSLLCSSLPRADAEPTSGELKVWLPVVMKGWRPSPASPTPTRTLTPAAPTPTLTPGPTTGTSDELIDAALARGEISAEMALIYKVFAVFGDPQLPVRYQGDDSGVKDSDIAFKVVAAFDSLSPQGQALLAPYRLRPSEPGSWLELREGVLAAAGGSAAAAIQWGTVSTTNGKAKIWYQKRYAGDDLDAADIARAINTIWQKLYDVMGREPMSDAGLPNNGGDGRLDIYLVHIRDFSLGVVGETWPRAGCAGTSSYILIDDRVLIGGESYSGQLQNVVHELMHSFQLNFNQHGSCSEYLWWMDASATWAEDYVYPLANSEQVQAKTFFDTPNLPLEDDRHRYGAYLLPFYLTRQPDGVSSVSKAQIIRHIWEWDELDNSLAAVNWAVPGGLEKVWPEYVVRNWNQLPADDYLRWDALEGHAKVAERGNTTVTLGSDSDAELPMLVYLEHLTAQYYRYAFPDDSVRSVTFYNGLTFELSKFTSTEWDASYDQGTTYAWSPVTAEQKKGAKVQALIKIAGHDWSPVADWTDKPYQYFCRDQADQRLEELVIIYSNSEFEDRNDILQPLDLPPTLWVSNLGCWRWQGTAEMDTAMEFFFGCSSSGSRSAGVTWARQPLQDVANADGTFSLPYVTFTPMSGSVDWTYDVSGGLCPSEHSAGNHPLVSEDGELKLFAFTTDGLAHQAYRGEGKAMVGLDTPDYWFLANPYHNDAALKVKDQGRTMSEQWSVWIDAATGSTWGHSFTALREP